MKIILTAFGGKLQSSYLEWPENTTSRVELIMDFNLPSPWEGADISEMKTLPKPLYKRGVFEWTGKSKWSSDKNDFRTEIREYKLIDVK